MEFFEILTCLRTAVQPLPPPFPRPLEQEMVLIINPPLSLSLCPIIARTCSRSLTPSGSSSSPTPSPSSLMIPPPPPPPLLAAARGHADPAVIPVSRPGAVATPPVVPRLGGGGRLAQLAAGQPIACNCGQVFPNLDILERHMAKAHPENTNLVSQPNAWKSFPVFSSALSTTISRPHSRGHKAITVSRWICAVRILTATSVCSTWSFVWESEVSENVVILDTAASQQ